jgi:tRNA(fMet)-specific endonuclease VapC
MLDTNILIYLKKQMPVEVVKMFETVSKHDVCISSITMAELEFGVQNSKYPLRNKMALLLLLSEIEILSFGQKAAQAYGEIRKDLKDRGQIIGGNDLLIAAHAKAEDCILVTNNLKEFERVKGLNCQNWAQSIHS